MEVWNVPALNRMGNKIGKTVKVDILTSDVTRAQYACVCVEVNFNKPLKQKNACVG